MNFVDATLVRLADATQRNTLFAASALEGIARAAYDTDQLPLSGPYDAVFERVDLGSHLPARATGTLRWALADGRARGDGELTLDGLGGAPLGVSAVWHGAIVARSQPAAGRISAVTVRWTDVARVDADVVTALGALPAAPAALEAARRDALLARVQAALAHPAAIDAAWLDAWLDRHGVGSVAALLEHDLATLRPAALQVHFDTTVAPGPPSPVLLPLAAAVLIRDPATPDFSLEALVCTSKLAQRHLETLGAERPADAALPARQPITVVWLVPDTWFDDPDWPGGDPAATPAANRALRAAAAASWLAAEGIAIAALSP